MRKFFFLLLLLAGWAIIFWPIYSADLTPSGGQFSGGHPSEKPLPPAWENTERVQVLSPDDAALGGFPVTSSSAAGSCGDTYIIQNGDTLGEIARGCGLSMAELLAANPNIQNSNHIYSGERISLPDPQAGRGGADSADTGAIRIEQENAPAAGSPASFHPGSALKIEAGGLPPNTPVRIGLGLTTTGYTVLAQAQTGADGRISTTVMLPASAQPGDTAFIMVSTRGTPSVQRISEMFQISEN